MIRLKHGVAPFVSDVTLAASLSEDSGENNWRKRLTRCAMENEVPPSYEEATMTNPWDLVATYISDRDLCSACLVSRSWHQIFAPWLWGNPASHFGTGNDQVYVALTRFKRALPIASLQVRRLTHTLHLPPALSEMYEGPRAEWLRDVLEQLPCLQSLIVSQLPFFDHASLLMLRQRGKYAADANKDLPETFPLRLLIASRCANATSTGLIEACLRLPYLVFLDLSWTSSARETTLFRSWKTMPYLQVLKLRGIGLRDEDIETIAQSIGLRLRSLDVSHNKLTDRSIRTLLDSCFHSTKDIHSNLARRHLQHSTTEDWPAGMARHGDHILEQFRGSDLDERFLRHLTRASAGRMLTEDLPRPGLTHLYISNNYVTVEGLVSLVKTENLHVLDAAEIDTLKALRQPRRNSTAALTPAAVPGLEKLAPVLERHGTKNLTYLRVHHSIVTEETSFEYGHEPVSELGGEEIDRYRELEAPASVRSELDGDASVLPELDTPAPIYELAEGPDSPRYELPGDPIGTNTPVHRRIPSIQLQDTSQDVRRGASFAPEVVDPPQEEESSIQLSATGFTYVGNSPEPPVSPISPEHPTNGIQSPSDGFRSPLSHDSQKDAEEVAEQISKLDGRRRQVRQRTKGIARGLLPGSLPALRTLVLTDVPSFDDSNDKVIIAIKKFITDCAVEAQLASAQAILELPTLYVRGRPRFLYKAHRTRELFALSQIVLEMASTTSKPNLLLVRSPSRNSEDSGESPGLPAHIPGYDGFQQRERSSTGDPDSEAFWRAQEHDFTFFGEEECGLPERDPDRLLPRALYEGKMSLSVTPDSPETASLASNGVAQPIASPPTRGKDVVSTLAQWRRERKQASRAGRTEGHWKGEIKIVRTAVKR